MNPSQGNPTSGQLHRLPQLDVGHAQAGLAVRNITNPLSHTDGLHNQPPPPPTTLPAQREGPHSSGPTPTSPTRPAQTFMRPLKFVSNDGLPHSKRRRIKSACKTCQKRKTRCSGEEPTCETCRQNGHKCMGYKKPPTPAPKKGKGAPASSAISPTLCSPTRPTQHHQRHASQPAILPSSFGRYLDIETKETGGEGKRKFPQDGGEMYDRASLATKRRNSESKVTVQSLLSDYKAGVSRMPYFRYFGPTAIVPGYKQMVVEVRNRKPAPSGSASVSTGSSITSPVLAHSGLAAGPQLAPVEQEDLPLYDINDAAPNHELITHLAKTFFSHVGCSFPFLREATFLAELEKKTVDPILVDAVCAVAARFSDHRILEGATRQSAKGTGFATRASALVVEKFACPDLPTVQAYLLLAYAEFANAKDSSLWMFLGCAIRMAVDLGLHKPEGTRGARSPRRMEQQCVQEMDRENGGPLKEMDEEDIEEAPAKSPEESTRAALDDETIEKQLERTNTFWCIYFLDRAICSGVGRPVTLRDSDIKIPLPKKVDIDSSPFPTLIHMIRLYGETTDIVNAIERPSDATRHMFDQLQKKSHKLNQFINELRGTKLEWKVQNFQYFRSKGQSAAYVICHVWLHALDILIKWPSLTLAFEIPDVTLENKHLAVSAAHTIADIARFAFRDNNMSIFGNPFNSQPIYIAACAFLEARSLPAPPPSLRLEPSAIKTRNIDQLYKDCHQIIGALQQLWKGTGYLVTVLDQKEKGVTKPLLYTKEEMESATSKRTHRRWDPDVQQFDTQQWSAKYLSEIRQKNLLRDDTPDRTITGLTIAGNYGGTSELTYFYGRPDAPEIQPVNNFPDPTAVQLHNGQHQMLPAYAHQMAMPGPPTLGVQPGTTMPPPNVSGAFENHLPVQSMIYHDPVDPYNGAGFNWGPQGSDFMTQSTNVEPRELDKIFYSITGSFNAQNEEY